MTIIQFTPGTIKYVLSNTTAPGKTWSGVTDTVEFKGKTTGQATVTYMVE